MIPRIVRESFGDMPSRRVIVARLMVFGALVAMSAVGVLILAAYSWLAVWMAK